MEKFTKLQQDLILARCRIQIQNRKPPPGTEGYCWVWTGRTAGNERQHYGILSIDGKCFTVRRLLYSLLFSRRKVGDSVLQCTCGTPLCVNPAHMEAVKRLKGGRRRRSRR